MSGDSQKANEDLVRSGVAEFDFQLYPAGDRASRPCHFRATISHRRLSRETSNKTDSPEARLGGSGSLGVARACRVVDGARWDVAKGRALPTHRLERRVGIQLVAVVEEIAAQLRDLGIGGNAHHHASRKHERAGVSCGISIGLHLFCGDTTLGKKTGQGCAQCQDGRARPR